MSTSKQNKIANAIAEARTLHKNGQLPQAMAAYKKILRTAPSQPDALHYLGLAFYQAGQPEAAVAHIQRSLSVDPLYLDAMNNLANIYKETERVAQAQNLYARVLAIAPDHVQALVNMAVVLRETKHTDEALKFVQRALLIQPQHSVVQHTLGNIYADLKQLDQAELAFRRALSLEPHHQVTTIRLAQVLHKSDRQAEAIELLQDLLVKKPKDAVAQHLLASYSHQDIPPRASDSYIKQTFDSYSAYFDQALAQLQYQVPELICEQLIASAQQFATPLDILDIGCGTGLCALYLQQLTRSLVGVDLSGKMLAKAAQRQLYDELHQAELSDYMQHCARQFHYVICADTLVYFGDLQQVFADVFNVLQPTGFFIFSVEQHRSSEATSAYLLQENGRYCHQQRYLSAALQAAGFSIKLMQDIVPRLEGGQHVDGALVVAQKPG